VALAIGIGLQNLPEGMAAYRCRCAEGMGRFKAFMWPGIGHGGTNRRVWERQPVLAISRCCPTLWRSRRRHDLVVSMNSSRKHSKREHHAATTGGMLVALMMVLDASAS
jgi:zinc transporter ZupT